MYAPAPGQIVNYWYAWGMDESGKALPAEKPRPCVILAVKETSDGSRVRLAPITHTAPKTPHDGIRLSKKSCARMGLDDRPQWISTRSTNVDTFPSDEMEPIRGSNPPTALYGHLPAKIEQAIKQEIARNHRIGKLLQVKRDLPKGHTKDQGIER